MGRWALKAHRAGCEGVARGCAADSQSPRSIGPSMGGGKGNGAAIEGEGQLARAASMLDGREGEAGARVALLPPLPSGDGQGNVLDRNVVVTRIRAGRPDDDGPANQKRRGHGGLLTQDGSHRRDEIGRRKKTKAAARRGRGPDHFPGGPPALPVWTAGARGAQASSRADQQKHDAGHKTADEMPSRRPKESEWR